MKVRISRLLLEQIMSHAASSDAEVCGLLLGHSACITDARAAANVAPDTARHFELDPATLLAAHKAARVGGAAIVGHYHSHPSGFPEPSATDIACASPDGSLWLIVGRGEARLWVASMDRTEKVTFSEAKLDVM